MLVQTVNVGEKKVHINQLNQHTRGLGMKKETLLLQVLNKLVESVIPVRMIFALRELVAELVVAKNAADCRIKADGQRSLAKEGVEEDCQPHVGEKGLQLTRCANVRKSGVDDHRSIDRRLAVASGVVCRCSRDGDSSRSFLLVQVRLCADDNVIDAKTLVNVSRKLSKLFQRAHEFLVRKPSSDRDAEPIFARARNVIRDVMSLQPVNADFDDVADANK